MSKITEQTLTLIRQLHNPPLFSLRRAEQENELIASIGHSGEREAFVYLLPFLLEDSTIATTARAIAKLFEQLTVKQLWTFAEFRGGRCLLEFRDKVSAWYQLAPERIVSLANSEPASVWALGMASAHGNGRVREEAIRLLALRPEPLALFFIVPHMNDWVPQIRIRAKTAVLERLQSAPAQLAAALPIVDCLKAGRRDNHGPFVTAIYRALQSEHGLASLRFAMASDDRLTRRLAFKLALASNDACVQELIPSALASEDVVVRTFAARLVVATPELHQWRETLLRSRFVTLRRLVFERAAEDNDVEVLTIFLMDASRGLRRDACFYMKRRTHVDIARIYRVATGIEHTAAIGILGLGEQRSLDDRPLIRAALKDPRPGVRAAAVTATAHSLGVEARDSIAESLADPSPAVSRAATAALEKMPGVLSPSQLVSIFSKASSAHVRRSVIHLVTVLPQWTAALYLLRFSREPDPSSRQAAHELQAWLVRARRSFVSLSAKEADDLQQALAVAPLSEDLSDGIADIIRQWTAPQAKV